MFFLLISGVGKSMFQNCCNLFKVYPHIAWTNPAVRKEQNRIRFVEREERQKPENQGRDVKYDFESRCLLVDGIVVDRFKPSFF